jgi:hypothetical protein
MAETKDDLQAKLEAARRALEGEEHTAKREQGEKLKAVQNERQQLEQHLAEIAKQKETLDLSWVDLDSKRKTARALLNPILDEEKKVEEEEIKLEAEEARIGVESEKHKVEEQRWAIQAKRKEVEQRKWVEEQKLVTVEKNIEENTQKYRILIDDEDRSNARLEQLKAQEI